MVGLLVSGTNLAHALVVEMPAVTSGSVATTTYCVGSHVRLGTFNDCRVQCGPILFLDEYNVDISVLVGTSLGDADSKCLKESFVVPHF